VVCAGFLVVRDRSFQSFRGLFGLFWTVMDGIDRFDLSRTVRY
jgi:hypothetical protein